jgi:signal peptidase II
LRKSLIIVSIILLFDQVLKFWIKTNMSLGQEFKILGNWFIIHFTENPGMAFGLEFAGEYGKLALSIFRIIAIIGIIYYIYHITRSKVSNGLIISLSLILAGAMGNMIDSAFYGMLFSSSNYFEVARFLPAEGGYTTFLHGKVVDMFYFPIIQGYYPSWVPWLGGNEFIFFRPVFNLADSSISVGVFLMIIFQKQFFHPGGAAKTPEAEENPEVVDQQE